MTCTGGIMDGIVVTMNPNEESMSHPPYNDNPARTTTRLLILAASPMTAYEEQTYANNLMQRLLPCGANIWPPSLKSVITPSPRLTTPVPCLHFNTILKKKKINRINRRNFENYCHTKSVSEKRRPSTSLRARLSCPTFSTNLKYS